MKNFKLLLPLLLSVLIIISCNNNKSTKGDAPGTDTTGANPTKNAASYQPDQSQVIPTSDSSNTIGTDTLNSSASAPNTGTNKSYLDAKGNKSDSSKHKH